MIAPHLSEHMKISEENVSDRQDGYRILRADDEGSVEKGPFLSEPIAVIGMGT